MSQPLAQPGNEPDPQPGQNPSSWLPALLVLLTLAGLGISAYFGIRALHSYRQLHRLQLHPVQTDVNLVQSWMTVPYIARAYQVPEAVLWQNLGIPDRGNRVKSLRALDRQYAGGQPGVILEKVKEIITQYHSAHPILPGLPPPTSTPRQANQLFQPADP